MLNFVDLKCEFKDYDEVISINIDTISYMEAYGGRTLIHLVSGRDIYAICPKADIIKILKCEAYELVKS